MIGAGVSFGEAIWHPFSASLVPPHPSTITQKPDMVCSRKRKHHIWGFKSKRCFSIAAFFDFSAKKYPLWSEIVAEWFKVV